MKIKLIIFLLFFAESFIAQQYNFQKYSIEKGLPRSGTYTLIQDDEGYLWVGTQGGGVAVFDGHTFKELKYNDQLPSQIVRVIFQDSKGIFWFGTTKGLAKYDSKTLQTFTTSDGLSDNFIRSICEDNDGNIWIGTSNGLNKYDGTDFTKYSIEDGILDYKVRIVFSDSKGYIWIGSDLGIVKYKDNKFIKYEHNWDLPHPLILDIYEDSKGIIYIGTKKGLGVQNGYKFKTYDLKDGIIYERIKTITEDKSGNIWLGTKKGISKFSNNKFINYSENNGISNHRIRDLISDTEGNIWFATYYGGINKLSENDFVTFTTNEGLSSHQVFSIFQTSEKEIILGTVDGISKLQFNNDGSFDTIINHTSKLKETKINDIFKDSYSNLWYATDKGILLKSKDSELIINKDQGLSSNEITCIYQKDKNNFWIGTKEGLNLLHFNAYPNIFQISNLDSNSTSKHVSSIIKDSNSVVWLGFRDGGVSIYKDSIFSIIESISNKNITTLIKDDRSTIWIGTENNGIYAFDFNDYDEYILHLGINEGLSSNHISSFVFDNNKDLWVASLKGVDKIHFINERGINNIFNFGIKDGLKAIEMNSNSILSDINGNIWIGSVDGVSVRYNNTIRINEEKLPVLHFTSLMIHNESFYQEVLLETFTSFDEKNEYEFDYIGKNHFELEFIGLYYSKPEEVKYKWILEGYDVSWSSPSNTNKLKYSNLPAGKYEFKLLSCNENGVWNKEERKIKLIINPPFWQKPLFIILIILCFGLLIFGIFQWRLSKLKKAKKHLEEKIKDATFELRKEKKIIEEKNSQINSQNLKLEEFNKSIKDSIVYARRIQSAIMKPSSTSQYLHLKNKMFIYYQAKDIVSGDFYWFNDIEDSSYVTVADCTGHGVPGALISMIGMTTIRQIVFENKTIQPNDLLFELRNRIIKALDYDSEDSSKDGMDIAFCKIDWKKNILYFSGANNPLYLIRNNELIEIKPDRMPIGNHDFSSKKFTLHEVNLQKNDMIYIFSDGFHDQFGGDKGKKYKSRQFKLFLQSIYDMNIKKQKTALENEFNRWKGNYEQIDDICIVGIKIT